MGKLRDRIERLMFGYTAEERAEIQRRFIDWRIEQVVGDSLDRLIAEDETEEGERNEETEAAHD